MVLAGLKGMPSHPILLPNFITFASHWFFKNTALPSQQEDWRSLADRRHLLHASTFLKLKSVHLSFSQAHLSSVTVFSADVSPCGQHLSKCMCLNTPSIDTARARGRVVLQPPCSAAQLLCIRSLRGQRVLFQSHCGQIYISQYSVILPCPLTSRFLPAQLPPMVPKLPQREGKVRFVWFGFILNFF